MQCKVFNDKLCEMSFKGFHLLTRYCYYYYILKVAKSFLKFCVLWKCVRNILRVRNVIKEYDTHMNSIFKDIAMTIMGETSWKKGKNVLWLWWMRRDTFLVLLERWENKLELANILHFCEEMVAVPDLVLYAGIFLEKNFKWKMKGK